MDKMTVKEVAEALGYETRTVQLKVKELFPAIVEAGKTTMLNEAQVTAIKMDCEKKFAVTTDLTLKSKLESAVTSLDIEEMTVIDSLE